LDTFETARLQARRFRATDLAYLTLTDTDPDIVRTTYGRASTREESEQRLERWLREEREAHLGFWIFTLNGENIGHAGLFRSGRIPGEIELGYALRPSFWHRGYATEMAQAIITRVARTLRLHRLTALTYPDNTTSQRVLDKCGFSPIDDYVTPQGDISPRYLLDLTQD